MHAVQRDAINVTLLTSSVSVYADT